MDVLAVHNAQGFLAVIGQEGVVALGLQIDFQGRDNILFVVADQYVVHSLHLVHIVR